MKLNFGRGTAHAARLVNWLIWSAVLLAVAAIGIRWLANLLGSVLVAAAVVGLAFISVASLCVEGDVRHPPWC